MPLTWIAPPRVIAEGCDRYSVALEDGIYRLAQEEAIVITGEMRRDAPWVDRTGNARAGLKAQVSRNGHQVTLTAGGSVPYQIWLELGSSKMAPRAIINPTLERHYAPIMQKCRALVGV